MNAQFHKVFVLLMAGAILVSACGGAPNAQPQSLVIPESQIFPGDFPDVVNETTGVWGRKVVAIGDNYYCFWQCMYPGERISISGDGKWIRREFPEVLREGTSSIDDFIFGARASVEYAGLDPNMVTRNGRIVTWPVLGIPTELYLKQYGVRPELVVDAAVESMVEISRLGAIDVQDVKFDNGVINPKSGKFIHIDWQFITIDTEARSAGIFNFKKFEIRLTSEGDYRRYLREQYQSDIDLYYANLEKQAGKPAPTLQAVSDFPTSPSELKDGAWFRGRKLMVNPELPDWYIYKRGQMSIPDNQTWVSVQEGRVWWGRVVRGEVYAQQHLDAVRINLGINGISPELATRISLGREDLWLIKSPDLGLDWDYYWGTRPWDASIYERWAAKGVDAYVDLHKSGVAVRADIGVHQLVVRLGPKGEIVGVAVVDFDNAFFRNSATGMYDETYVTNNVDIYAQQVRESFMSDLDLPMATPPPPVVQAADDLDNFIVETKPVTVRVLAADTLEPYQMVLTQEELAILRNGGDDAVALLVRNNVPVPKPSGLVRGLTFVGKGVLTALEVAGYVWMVYEIGETWLDVAGMGESYQLNMTLELIPIDPNDAEVVSDYESLVSMGFVWSPAMNVYRTTLDDIYLGAISNSVASVGCRTPRLEDASEQSFPGMPDQDILVPVFECANPSQVILHNRETGEESVWAPNGTEWTLVSGPACTSFTTMDQGGAGDIVVFPMEVCAFSDGDVVYQPTWNK